MGWPSLLLLIRHAESVGNIRSAEERAGFAMATHAYPLTPRGQEQARITGAYLRERYPKFDVYYTSYYRRSIETLEWCWPGVRAYEDFRLAEAQRGIWHTMTKETIDFRFPEERLRKEREGLYHYRPFGGENWPDVQLRIHSFLTTLARDYDGMSVCIVAHGHWMILFQQLIEHFSIDEALARYRAGRFANASLTTYVGKIVNGKHRLVLEQENVVPWQGKLDDPAFSEGC